MFYIEFFKSVITAEPQKDNAFNLRTTTRLLIHMDTLAHRNPDKRDIFSRSYAHLVLIAFPVIIKCLKIDIFRSQMPEDSQFLPIAITSSNTKYLRFFMNNCKLGLGLLSDMIQVISFLSNQRPLMLGQLTVKDAKVMQVFNEIVVEYVTLNQNELQHQLTTQQGLLLSKLFKDSTRSDPFSSALFSTNFVAEHSDNSAQIRQIKLVVDYLVNFMCHTIISQAPFQIARFD